MGGVDEDLGQGVLQQHLGDARAFADVDALVMVPGIVLLPAGVRGRDRCTGPVTEICARCSEGCTARSVC